MLFIDHESYSVFIGDFHLIAPPEKVAKAYHGKDIVIFDVEQMGDAFMLKPRPKQYPREG